MALDLAADSSSQHEDIELQGEQTGGQRPPNSLPLPPTSRGDWWHDDYLEYPHAAQALYIYKHPCLLRNSNPDRTAKQSAALPQETKLPVRLLDTTNEWRIVQEHETPLKVKGDIEDASSELDSRC
ncbi:hypothetical protein TNCV_3403621 [Trichonephila clavipes]|nr:hypothetical protein TNCV_3403621 [Trichonephila clavipes]